MSVFGQRRYLAGRHAFAASTAVQTLSTAVIWRALLLLQFVYLVWRTGYTVTNQQVL